MAEVETLKQMLEKKEAELLQVKLQLIETKIGELQRNDADKELRLRQVETSRTRFEMLAWLACSSGAVSLLNLVLRLKL